MKKIITLGVALVISAAGTALPSDQAASGAVPHCVYVPRLPSRVKINQSVVGLRTPLKVEGSACAENYDVATNLVHLTDSYALLWMGSGPDVESVYAFEIKPGTYRTTGSTCDSYDNNYNTLTCSVRRASTVIKFAARSTLAVARVGATLTFHAATTRYADYRGFRPSKTTVAIQRRVGTRWETIHRGFANGKAGLTWSYRRIRAGTYRAVAAETSSAFSASSRTVLR